MMFIGVSYLKDKLYTFRLIQFILDFHTTYWLSPQYFETQRVHVMRKRVFLCFDVFVAYALDT